MDRARTPGLTAPSRSPDRPHGSRLRRGRASVTGQAYLVTTVTHARQPVFSDFPAARTLVRALQASDNRGRTVTLAFVIMPDHLHWLFTLEATISLSMAVAAVKAASARAIGKAPVWQRGFHDRAIRREEDLRPAARYIIANPLRAGLAQSVRQYPHWDAVWL